MVSPLWNPFRRPCTEYLNQIQVLLHYQPKRKIKKSCLCNKCLNMHLRLDGVNSFRKTIKLPFHTSVKVFGLNFQVLYPSFIDSATHDQILKEFLESMPNKEVSFYLLEIKEKCYYKKGKKKNVQQNCKSQQEGKGIWNNQNAFGSFLCVPWSSLACR